MIHLWRHQLEALRRVEGNTHFGLLFEQGCGKTPTAIKILEQKLAEAKRPLATLILGPAIVVENWRREFQKYSNVVSTTLAGTGKERVEKFLDAKKYVDVFVTNYESLYMKDLLKALEKHPWDCVILDESHRIKDRTSMRTKHCIALSKKATYRFILTGTFITNSAFDVYSQFLFLDKGETFGKSFFDFRNRFFVDRNAHRPKANYFPDWHIKAGALDEINQLVATKTMRITKDECLDLPPLVRQMVEFDLTPKQRQVYDTLQKHNVVRWGERIISSDLGLTKAIKLHQIISGFTKDDNDQVVVFDDNPRIACLEEVIENIPADKKIIIWAQFHHEYQDIKNLLTKLKIKCVMLTGETPQNARQPVIDMFNDLLSDYRAMVAHPKAGGIGVNLIAASYAIFYSRGFSWDDDSQAESRNHRGGSEIHEKVTRIDIIAKNTVDDIILLALRNKANVAEAILKQLEHGEHGEQQDGNTTNECNK